MSNQVASFAQSSRSASRRPDRQRPFAHLTPTVAIILLLLMPSPASGETLDFYSALGDALEQSHDIRLSHVDFRLTQNEIKNSLTDYLPTLRGQANMERMLDLTRGTSPVVVVGSTAIPNATRYQNAVYLSANWTVLDFGQRAQQLAAARKHRDAALAALRQT